MTTKEWVPCKSMSNKRTLLTLANAHGYIYALGGLVNDTVLSSVERYDFKEDLWYTVTPMIVPRSAAAASSINNYLYVVGGATKKNSGATASVERFDGELWTKVENIPTKMSSIDSIFFSFLVRLRK